MGTLASSTSSQRATLAMAITPPYFNVALAPGAVWESLVKFSNRSSYPITVFARTQNFRTDGGSGVEFFIQDSAIGTQSYELASWLTLPKGELVVPAGSTIHIPFVISVPLDAEPGGHYAGIIVGSDEVGTSVPGGVGVSSALSALLLVRVAGETNESGFIRNFSTRNFFTQTQQETFTLEFKNTGNVHLEPRGEIVISNMFGKNRGRISLKSGNSFGHILPFSTREFSFDWQGESNYLDIGLYQARATLYYGENDTKVAFHGAYFLIFPLVPVLGIATFLYVFTRFIRIGARRYVKHAIKIEQERLMSHGVTHERSKQLSAKILEQPFVIGLREFLAVGMGKKRKKIPKNRVIYERQTYTSLFRQYRPFFLFLLVLALGFMAILYYFFQVFQNEREYRVSVLGRTQTDVVGTDPRP